MPLEARYPTTCALCSRPVPVGDLIVKSGGRWVHEACAPGEDGALFGAGAAASPPDPDAPSAGPASAGAAAGAPAGQAPAKAAKAAGTKAAGAKAAAARVAPRGMREPSGALEVWTDGACSGNPGPGGWAWATQDGRQDSGGDAATTNQRMEIRAALEAVSTFDGPLVVVSDSTYVVNCFRDGWWKGWLARGWVNSQKKPVANRDLWEPLIEQVRARPDVAFRWVKGHSGDVMNDLVDRLAVEAAKAAAAT